MILHTNLGRSLQNAEALFPNGATFCYWNGEFLTRRKVRRIERLRQRHVAADDIYAVLDVDEFVQIATLRYCIQEFQTPAVYGWMVDRFATRPGCLGELHAEGDIFQQFPVARHSWSKNQLGSRQWKAFLFAGDLRYESVHNCGAYPYHIFRRKYRPVVLDHFKWATQRQAKAERRVESFKRAGRHPCWRESQRFLRILRATPKQS